MYELEKGQNPVFVSHPPTKHLRTPIDSLSLTRMKAAFEEGIDISPICPRTSTATYARAREGRCRKPKPFRLARVLMRERACARTRPRRGGNGYCAAPSLRYARVRVRTSDFIRIFFSFGENDKIIQKIVCFLRSKKIGIFLSADHIPAVYFPRPLPPRSFDLLSGIL